MLEYKLKDRGKYFVKVDKWFPSSQICCNCGNHHKLLLSERIYKCSCGNVIDRDYNAAINIKNKGIEMLKNSIRTIKNRDGIAQIYACGLCVRPESTSVEIGSKD
jgi:transposase